MKISHYSILPVLLLTLGLSACNSADDPITINEETKPDDERIVVSKKQFETEKMAMETLDQHPFSGALHCTGTIDVPPQYRADVSSYFGGYVKDIRLISGDKVKQGQALFYLENPMFIDMQQEFLEIKSQLGQLKTDYERQEKLFEGNATSEKLYLQAKSAYEIQLVKYEGLKQKLQMMSINTDKLESSTIRSSISINSPINGYITSVNITKGMFLSPEDVAITIEGTDHKHMELNIYEKDLNQVEVGQEITIRTADKYGEYYYGVVYLIDQSIDPEKRTVKVHGHFTDESEKTKKLVPGLYIEGDIKTFSKAAEGLATEAVVNLDEQNLVLLLVEEDEENYYFTKKMVTTGEQNDGYTEILNAVDFKPDSRFLTKGAYQLIQ